MSAEKLAALLDELIARDPDRARRFIESNLARIALMKRLAAKKSIAAHEAEQEQEQAGEAVAYLNQCRKRPELRTLSFKPDLSLRAKGFQAIPLYTRPQQPLTRELKELEADLNELSDGAYLCPGWDVRRLRTALGITKDSKAND